MNSVGIIGGGAFGTGLAIALSRVLNVTIWARNSAEFSQIRTSPKLPGHPLPDRVKVVSDLSDLQGDIALLALPMQALSAFLETHISDISAPHLVACCKGIDVRSGRGPVEVMTDVAPDRKCGVLTGPSFAVDIARGLPTALTLAMQDPALVGNIREQLKNPGIRLYSSTDFIGAQMGGALKNVMAIGCGAVMGAGLGASARAALMTRGFAEMSRFAVARGAQPETLAGLSGFGDLVLTCTSENSRNYRFGLSLGQGEPFDPGTTVEGAATARAMRNIAQAEGLDMPICTTVAELVDGNTDIQGAMTRLLSRPLKEE